MLKRTIIKKTPTIPTALIAGGAGFIGSHLSEALLAKGTRVIVVDNFKTGKQIYVNHLLTNPNFALYDYDLNAGLPEDIESVDYVIHLAGLEEYLYNKEFIDLNSLLTNAFGTKNLLDLAVRSQAKFLLVSSIDVYEGRMSQIEIEQYFGKTKIDDNKYMLTEAKRYAEALVWEYYKKNQMDARIVRLPEIYGPRMNLDSSGSLGVLMKDLLEHRDLNVKGDGSAKSYYLYVIDAVSGILKSLFNKDTKGNIYSLIEKQSYSVLEVAYIFKSIADGDVKINFVSEISNNTIQFNVRTPDTYFLNGLNWEPKVSLKDGIIRSLESFEYKVNTQSFKPAQLIVERQKNINALNSTESLIDLVPANQLSHMPELFTLQDVKQPQVQKPPESLPQVVQTQAPPPQKKPRFPNVSKIFTKKVVAVFAIIIGLFVVFVCTPVLLTFNSARQGIIHLEEINKLGLQANSEDLSGNSKIAYENFYKAKSYLPNIKWLFTVTNQSQTYTSVDKSLSSLAFFSKAIYTASKAYKPFETLYQVIRPDTKDSIDKQVFDDAKTQLEGAKSNLQIALGEFSGIDVNKLPQKYRTSAAEYGRLLNNAISLVDQSTPVVTAVPELLGLTETKKYLVLFQNSNEIRATGGFIGSYALIEFEKGKITQLFIDDVYNPDGQIDIRNIKTPVPDAIKQYLKETNLHIRNANWNPDFNISAQTIEDLYFKVTGEKVDGVIAVDLNLVKNILRATGPVFLTAYNEEINAENLDERTQMHSEFNYTEGSSQKRDFLTVLGSKLMEKLFSLKPEQLGQLSSALIESLNGKHLLIYLSNNSLSAFIKEKNWDGGLVQTDGDYLYVVNSNLSGTKANYFVENDYAYTITSQTRDGVLRGELVLEYTHNGKDAAWPGGPYTNYVRVLTQKDSKLTGATITIGTTNPAVDIFKTVVTETYTPYTSFGYGFTINPGEKAILRLNYDLDPTLNLSKDKKEYKLYWQKQSGTDTDSFSINFSQPFGFKIIDSSPNLTGNLQVDKQFYVKLQ